MAVLLYLGPISANAAPELISAEFGVDAVAVEHPPIRNILPPLPLETLKNIDFLDRMAPAEIVASEQVEAIERWNLDGRQPAKTGFTRPLSTSHHVALTVEAFNKPSDTGNLYARQDGDLLFATRLAVEGAQRLRLHLSEVDLPAGSELWVAGTEGDVTRFGLELLREEQRDLWTPSVSGDVIHLQVRVPSVDPSLKASHGFRLDSVAQIFPQAAIGASSDDDTLKGTPDCLLDAACFDNTNLANLDLYKDAVAYLEFVQGGSVFTCSGALINDSDDSGFIPYLLTSNLCIPTQTVASTLESFFDVIPESCGGPAPSLSSRPRVVGSTLLATTTTNNDWSFLRLTNNPSGTTGYLGWDTNLIAAGSDLYKLSHPLGLTQGFSLTIALDSPPLCSGLSTNRFLYSSQLFGGTAAGSHGAPVVDVSLRVRGVNWGLCGPNVEDRCDYANNQVDGRLSDFFDEIRSFLAPTVPDCVASSTALCLNDERFQVEGTWRNFEGETGQFQAVPFTSDSGMFWFFDSSNIEFLVKVLDGCGFNDHFWVFAAATTNVEYTLQVTDTATGVVRTFFNPLGRAAPALTDTFAFATCP